MDSEEIKNFKTLNQKEQREKLRLWDKMYYQLDAPIVSDETYDACLAYFNSVSKRKYQTSLGKALTKFKKYNHNIPILSLDKIHTKEEYMKYGEKFNYETVIEPKIDGLTVVYYPDGSLVSRGDGHVGEILPNAKFIPSLPKQLDKPVRMEVCIDKEVFEKQFKNSNKNPRNMAAGILRRTEYTDDIKYLTYYAYNILDKDLTLSEQNQLLKLQQTGFKIVDKIITKNKEEYEKQFDLLYDYMNLFPAPTDGIVIKCNGSKIADFTESTAHHPKHMIAFKFSNVIKNTTLKSVEWSRGRNIFTPVATFCPVVINGNTITKASIHNLGIIKKLGLRKNSIISVALKNEIIPQIVDVKNKNIGPEIIPIEKCPDCGSNLIINESEQLECPNKNCPALLVDNIKRLSSREALNLEGISETYAKLFSNYLREKNSYKAFDVLLLETSEIKEALNCTDYMANKLYNQIKSKKIDVDPAKFLYACNIPNLGKNMAKDIMAYYKNNIEDFLLKFEFDGKYINGIGDKIHKSIMDNIDQIKKNKLVVQFVAISEQINENKTKYKIAITGKLNHPRKYYQDIIEKSGHTFSFSLTKDVDYLVCGEDPGRKKTKAEFYNIKIILENKLEEVLK